MKELNIKITYDLKNAGENVLTMDHTINKLMNCLGAKWTGQGYNAINGIRDINFTINLDKSKGGQDGQDN